MAPLVSAFLPGCFSGVDDLARAELSYFQGDLGEAERRAHAALRRAREGGQYEIENRALFYLLRIALAGGEGDKLPGILERLEERQPELWKNLNRQISYDIVTGWFYAQIGQTEKTASWLKNDFEESDLNSLVFGLEVLVKAKCLLAEKRFPAALAIAGSQEAGVGAYLFGRLEMKVLEAVCLYRGGQKAAAFAALAEAYRVSLPYRLTAPFFEMGRDMRALTAAALKAAAPALPREWLQETYRMSSAYAKKLYKVAEEYAEPAAREGAILSPRERKILRDLAQGLTREEIAQSAGISMNTVKSGIASIYNKLGAFNRADAVHIATSQGLLDTTTGKKF